MSSSPGWRQEREWRLDAPPTCSQAVLLDLQRESEHLYRTYRAEVINYSLLGAAVIVVLLFGSLRSPRRVFDVLAPLAAAVIVTSSVLAFSKVSSIGK